MSVVTRTIKSMYSEIRKMALKNREGIVIKNVVTKDIDEYINGITICFNNLNIIDLNITNRPIVIKINNTEYIILIMIKIGYEDELNSNRLKKHFNNIETFSDWVKQINII